MTFLGWAQIALVLAAIVAAAIPLARYIAAVADGPRHLPRADRARNLCRGRIDPAREQGWRAYALAMLAFNAAGFVLLYAHPAAARRSAFQSARIRGSPPGLAFNTAVSFVTNTNWQAYGGETTMSHFRQMAGLTVQNFLSAATGLALAMALCRAFARSKASTWVISGPI